MTDAANAGALPIDIDGEIAELVNGAHENGTPLYVAYVDAAGQPHLSLRGSTQAHGKDQLALWIREPTGGLLKAIPDNPRITLMYRDTKTRINYLFYGRMHIDRDEATARAVYDKSSKAERDRDPERAGVAVIIDLDVVQGGPPDRKILMRRS